MLGLLQLVPIGISSHYNQFTYYNIIHFINIISRLFTTNKERHLFVANYILDIVGVATFCIQQPKIKYTNHIITDVIYVLNFCIFNIFVHIDYNVYIKYSTPIVSMLYKNDESQVCSICLETFCKNDMIHQYKCTHIYHKKCSMEILRTTNLCPLCRSIIKPNLGTC